MFNFSNPSAARILICLAGIAVTASVLGLSNLTGLNIRVMNSLANSPSDVTDKVVLVSWTTGAIAGFLCGIALLALQRLARQRRPDRELLPQ